MELLQRNKQSSSFLVSLSYHSGDNPPWGGFSTPRSTPSQFSGALLTCSLRADAVNHHATHEDITVALLATTLDVCQAFYQVENFLCSISSPKVKTGREDGALTFEIFWKKNRVSDAGICSSLASPFNSLPPPPTRPPSSSVSGYFPI